MTSIKMTDVYREKKILEFIRFCIVGAFCTAIDAVVFYATHTLLGYRVAIVLGFCISLSFNYVLNTTWSFKAKPTKKNAIGMLLAHCFNIFVVRMSLMYVFMNYTSMSEDIAYIPTLIISVITNFIIVRYVMKH